jgi:predicted HicB family RNase H-like nuclease
MEDKIQTGLRIPERQYNRVKEKADRMGVSINQLILVLIDTGLNFLDREQQE